MSGAQETALTLARELSGAGEAEEALLELLCQAAEQQWEKRLRPGMTTEDCGKAFPCAVAFTAAADLAAARGGEGVTGFTAGSVSVRIRGAAESCGEITPEAAEKTGLLAGTKVAGGAFAIDACA